MADVHECPVFPSESANTTALGAALRAAHAADSMGWTELSSAYCKTAAPVNALPETFDAYRRLAERHSRAEQSALQTMRE